MNMNIEEIGLVLMNIRKTYTPKYVYPEDMKPYSIHTKQSIEVGNCNIKSLFIYIRALGLVLTANGQPVNDVKEFGEFLAKLRQSVKKSQFAVAVETGLTNARIVRIEKGYGAYKKTLLTYLTALPPINFDLIDKHGLYT